MSSALAICSTSDLSGCFDFSAPTFWIACASIIFNPTWWNIVARLEYRSQLLTRLACGSKYAGCYGLAFAIFTLGLLRDWLFKVAVDDQPRLDLGSLALAVTLLGYVLFGVGSVFVATSMWRLGVTGTYLGDYFGILMDARVEGFPFNVLEHPMYTGSTMCFLSQALIAASPAGVALSGVVCVVYVVAQSFEGPFTSMIYAKRETERAAVASARKSSIKKRQ
eukprot:a1814_461.p1 GENE.a1814_461~~a1814_461.p1  ORF type:complete len:234 (-),score=78.80 a1814_461:24-689(-)